jgi:hypothetical protein
MIRPNLLVAAFFTGGAALQRPGTVDYISVVDDCYTGRNLYFVHVMKDGGTSIGKYFECLANKTKFAFRRRQGPNELDIAHTECPPAICSAHHPAVLQTEVCGSEFSNASSFTVLREPVARAFSLYNYYRNEMIEKKDIAQKMKPFSTFGSLLRHLLRNEETGDHEFDSYMRRAFSNQMVKFWFSPPITFDSIKVASRGDLENAKNVLRQLNAVFFTEQLSSWKDDFRKSALPLSQHADDCEVPHEFAKLTNNCLECADAPTDEEIKLATKLNQFDIELYEFAKTLPNAYR